MDIWAFLRITKAKAKVKFGVKYLCEHEYERSSVQLISIRKRKQEIKTFGITFTLISALTVPSGPKRHPNTKISFQESHA